MGTSEGTDGPVAGDVVVVGGGGGGGVGSLVWVRRRNGSWWPGRILGTDELPASPLMSPKSGTPVKLLGREDASVEWYNLEKSIRVKAFRCGEFDACIERAEASQGAPIKRREKYARREDAILHALELEKQQLEIKLQKPGSITNSTSTKTSSLIKSELNNCSSENYTNNTEAVGCSQFANHKSQMFSRRVLTSLEEDNMGNSSYMHKGRDDKPYGREEDDPESIPRTRGLQDFGLRIAPAKKKHYQFVAWDSLQKPVDNHAGALPSAGHSTGGSRNASSSKNSLPAKRKSSQGSILEESPAKRRDRRRPLVQVLESSAKLPSLHSFQPDHEVGIIPIQGEKDHMGAICRAKRSRCIYLPADSNDPLDQVGYSFKQMPMPQTTMNSCHPYRGSLGDENTSSGFEAMESDSSERDCLETDIEEEDNLLREDNTLMPVSKNSGRYVRCSPTVSQMHPNEHTADASVEVGVSKWHMKGKRNIRNLAKSPTNIMEGTVFNSGDKCTGSVEGTSYETKGAGFKMRTDHCSRRAIGYGFYPKKEFNYPCDDGDFIDKDTGHTQSLGFSNRKYPLSLKAAKARAGSFVDSDDDSHVIPQAGWEADGPSNSGRRTYWKEPEFFAPNYADHLGDEMEPMLVDVDLKVRASYQGEHVPLVSLMSRLNGKAIIGHPVQVEILEDGSSGSIVSRHESILDESTVPSPVWKTARRTAIQRVPRSNPAPSALDGEDSEPLQGSDFESKPPLKKAYSGHFSHQARLAKKSISHAHKSTSGKSQWKLLKSVSLSGQKIRTLSSLSTEQKRSSQNGDTKLNRGSGILGGLIKPEGAVPLVTCIPLKVVFSRILEAVGRPLPSVANRVLVNGSTTRDLS